MSDYEDEYEEDFLEESTVPTPNAATAAAAASKPVPVRQSSVSLSALKLAYAQPIVSTSSTAAATSALVKTPVVSSFTDDAARVRELEARVRELEARVETLEREVAASRVKLRRAGRNGAATEEGAPPPAAAAASYTSYANVSVAPAASAPQVRVVPFTSLQLGEQISGGGFCLLYRGRWAGAEVAIKRMFDPNITPALLAEFRNEVNMLARLAHPHVVQILAQVTQGTNLCVVTEFLARGSLYHVLHESRVEMTRARRISMSLQMASALAFVHSNNTIHRDIKSHNALADEVLKVKLCDLGMAITLDELAQQVATPGRKQEVAGTPNYMCPSLWQGQPASIASDIYAYGILLGEIWSAGSDGAVPWEGVEVQEIRRRVLQGERPQLPLTIPRDVVALIRDCTAQQVDKRPKDLGKVVAALTAMQA